MSVVVKTKNLKYAYKQKKNVLENIDLQIESNTVIALVGPNGSGKSTLLKCLAGLAGDYEGLINIDGFTTGTKDAQAIVSYIPDSLFLSKELKIKDIVDMHTLTFPSFSKEKFVEMINKMDLALNQSIKELSKGMVAKLQIALAMSKKAKIYLLDEPFGGIDPLSRDEIVKTIIRNYSEDGAILISTHELTDTESLYDRVLFLKEGKIERDENTEEVRMAGMSLKEIYMEVFSK